MKNRLRIFLPRLAVVLFALPASLTAAPPQGDKQKEVKTVAKVREVDGALLSRAAPGTAWQPLKAGAAVGAGRLVVALPGARLASSNDAVLLRMLADIGKRGPFPVFESAVRIHDTPKVDLDFTLDRGIVAVMNLKTKGAATVRVRLDGKTFDLTLKEPGTVVGMEIFGRHPPCTPTVGLNKKGQVTCKDHPTQDLVLLVVKGAATLRSGGQDYALHAPPGPASLQWDNVGNQVAINNLEKLPTTILPTGPDEEKYYKLICERARRLAEEPLDKVLQEYRASKEPSERRAASVVSAALDDLPGVLAALADPKSADVRDFTVTVLRNWIGRHPGQVERLFDTLLKEEKYTPAQAKTLVHLLYGATDQQKKEPATYEVLIALLKHSKLPIRELARWHLVRLAPAGKKIDFDAAAPEAERLKAYAQWRALIPEGQLPPRLEARPPEKK